MAASFGQSGAVVASARAVAVDGPAGDSFWKIRELLEQETFLVEFFQAVRLLERMEGGREAVGYFVAPHSEALRFSALPSLAFPPSQLYELQRQENGQLRLVVRFMGLCAAVSVLPDVYTEHLLLLNKSDDPAMGDFFDLFNHRLISLFYRGWEKYRFFIGYEAGREDSLTPRMFDMVGLGTAGLRGRSSVADEAYLAYAGLLGRHVRTAEALKQILEDYFDVSIRIQEFVGTWRQLPLRNRSVLSGENQPSEMLGVGTVVGNEVWDHHGRIRISIGPMSFERYVSFLPGHEAHEALRDWVRFFSSGQYEAEVQLVLERADAPGCQLGMRGPQEPRLGLVSWLKTKPLERDPGDAVYLLT